MNARPTDKKWLLEHPVTPHCCSFTARMSFNEQLRPATRFRNALLANRVCFRFTNWGREEAHSPKKLAIKHTPLAIFSHIEPDPKTVSTSAQFQNTKQKTPVKYLFNARRHIPTIQKPAIITRRKKLRDTNPMFISVIQNRRVNFCKLIFYFQNRATI